MADEPGTRRWVATREFSPRHREILEAALELIAERGYAGASLRELARRVDLRQPSLYHYFDSKEQLVEQVIESFAGDMFLTSSQLPPENLADLPDGIVAYVDLQWSRPTHASFVRVSFAVARIDRRFGRLMREIFEDRAIEAEEFLARYYVERGEPFSREEIVKLVRLVSSAVNLRQMEYGVLYDPRPADEAKMEFARFVAQTARQWIEDRRRERSGS